MALFERNEMGIVGGGQTGSKNHLRTDDLKFTRRPPFFLKGKELIKVYHF